MSDLKIGILTIPISSAGIPPLRQLIDILAYLSKDIYLITGNDGYEYFSNYHRVTADGIRFEGSNNPFVRIIKYAHMQAIISYHVFRSRKNVDAWLFFIGGDGLVLPMITSKLLRKKTLLMFASSSVMTHKSKNDGFYVALKYLADINCRICDNVLLYSENVAREWGYVKFDRKISYVSQHFIDTGKFRPLLKYGERECVIGFVGRLSEEKGIKNFLGSLPQIFDAEKNARALIIGDGLLYDYVRNFIRANHYEDRVRLIGWVSHDDLPGYLNRLKLAVIPSYTEGLPNVLLESMACGTPVLASSVGSIPDLIVDGKNGYLMDGNAPDAIARQVLRAINNDNSNIIENGYSLVQKEYTFEAAVNKHLALFDKLDHDGPDS